MCDKIKDNDIRYADAQGKADQDGCSNANSRLNICLKANGNDWRKCSAETELLKQCFSKNKPVTAGGTPKKS